MDATTRATRRYYGALLPVTAVFLASSFGIAWLDTNTDAPATLLAALTLLPVAALFAMFWVQWRYIRALDEYLRHLHTKALLVGAAVALGIATGWGLFEAITDAPALWVFWLNPLFWIAYAVAVVGFSLRDNAGDAA